LLGAHESIAGGMHRAVERASADGCDALQVFTRSPRAWKEPPRPTEDQIQLFAETRARLGIGPVMAHASYLANLCAADPALRGRGWSVLAADAGRCDLLGIELLVFHPGSPGTLSEDEGLDLVARCVEHVLERSERVTVLVENTAGQGSSLGHRFEHLAQIVDRAGGGGRVGVCFDTAHAFAAGYELDNARSARRVFDELDAVVGPGRLRALHLNDSQAPRGSRVDRHAMLGQGLIGDALFSWLVGQRRFAGLPAVVETPIPRGETYRGEIALLRSLAGRRRPGFAVHERRRKV
jgi:deoxyribonuclease-4